LKFKNVIQDNTLLEKVQSLDTNEVYINTNFVIKGNFVPTFETNKFKILLPIPKSKNVANFLFNVFEFNVLFWIIASLIGMSLTLTLHFINKITQDPNDPSPGYFLVAFFMFFIGQSSSISST
jgi:hypothetical protein